jgi:hypothetical protein
MDLDIVRKYLLQVGRSWYQTDAFRRRYSFAPASKFGVGFLSVFAVSDHVQIETALVDAPSGLRLTLRGPRNYLLVERAEGLPPGTTVTVRLLRELDQRPLAELIRDMCPRVEFPIHVLELEEETVVRRESSVQFVARVPKSDPSPAAYEVRAFPLTDPALEGELYLFVYTDERGEWWHYSRHHRAAWRNADPVAFIPEPPDGIVCSHGIKVIGTPGLYSSDSIRVDYRLPGAEPVLSRGAFGHRLDHDERIATAWEGIIAAHLANRDLTSDRSWRYKQALQGEFNIPTFWRRCAGTFPTYESGDLVVRSLLEFNALEEGSCRPSGGKARAITIRREHSTRSSAPQRAAGLPIHPCDGA